MTLKELAAAVHREFELHPEWHDIDIKFGFYPAMNDDEVGTVTFTEQKYIAVQFRYNPIARNAYVGQSKKSIEQSKYRGK